MRFPHPGRKRTKTQVRQREYQIQGDREQRNGSVKENLPLRERENKETGQSNKIPHSGR
jgi:hypothetical protein